MAFEVCSDVTVVQGGSFSWHNGYAKGVVISPVTPPWPLPQSSYNVGNGATSSAISVPANAATGSWTLNVLYSTSAGGPCGAADTGNPKLIINPPSKKK
jgi:hypothetical protein